MKKTDRKKVSSILKKLIEELLTNVLIFTAEKNLKKVSKKLTSIFL